MTTMSIGGRDVIAQGGCVNLEGPNHWNGEQLRSDYDSIGTNRCDHIGSVRIFTPSI